MANPHRGDVALKTRDVTYTLRFSIDALCSLEEATGKPFAVAAAEMANPMTVSFTLVRHLLHAAVREHHPDLTLREAGELIPLAGGLTKVSEKVFEAFRLAFPEVDEKKARPPKGAAAGGSPSS